ncbi:MAG: DUF3455 domain-containing protein [Polyangiaceae bacterium]|nr:DUF3455 domain-containing protein [Polyangiaceae bacterium]
MKSASSSSLRVVRALQSVFCVAISGAALFACRPPNAPDAAGAPGASGGACPPSWLEAPAVDTAIAVPDIGSRVVLRVSAHGTQNYVCQGGAGTGSAWALQGPEAKLEDCHGTPVGDHSATGAGAPEWRFTDGTYVVAHKSTMVVIDKTAVPWLLLHVDEHGGTGPAAQSTNVQRVRTQGGLAPSDPCDASHTGAVQKVAYAAEYYFFGP